MESAAKQAAGFIAKFDPPVQKLIRECRAAVRKRYPAAVELIYDNYNFLVFGFGPSERAGEALLSLAAHSKGVNLFFLQGAALPDPTHILEGSGKQVRFIRLESAARLSDPHVDALFHSAEMNMRVPMPREGKGYTLVKSISAKQRPRSAAKTAGR
ncbi:MAG TPA: DUF1801 domain-containing protein [Candidatus Limnocylindrales bacterium]|nr:DUF1801 domain-containing protein [Candidatus Limnocylindrales bacterium]